MSERDALEVTLPVTVEFEDVDSFRIAHHTKLVAYLERARLRLLVSLGIGLDGRGPAPVMYDLEIRFRKPARLLDRLDVTAYVREVNEYRVTLGYRLRRDDETLVKASSTIAFANLEDGVLTTVPDSIVAGVAAARERRDAEARS